MRTKAVYVYSLSTKVLAVAVADYETNEDGVFGLFDWAVYIDAVPGHNHELEAKEVMRVGAKQSAALAHLLFPHLDIKKYRW